MRGIGTSFLGACLGLVALSIPTPVQATSVFSSSGSSAAAIQAQVDAFRADLGALNPNVAGSAGSGRREINWDGVPDSLAAPNLLPANFFNVNSPRGAVFSTAGTGFQVSANAGLTPIEFGNIDPSYPDLFAPFSPQRLFTAIGSNVVDVSFFIPGSTTPALTRGFGSVFSDVNAADLTSIEYFDVANHSLGSFYAPIFGGKETLSFLGVSFDNSVVSRVRITSGNQLLTAGNIALDLVVMDDFIYGEPVAVPEPASLALFGISVAGLCAVARRRRMG